MNVCAWGAFKTAPFANALLDSRRAAAADGPNNSLPAAENVSQARTTSPARTAWSSSAARRSRRSRPPRARGRRARTRSTPRVPPRRRAFGAGRARDSDAGHHGPGDQGQQRIALLPVPPPPQDDALTEGGDGLAGGEPMLLDAADGPQPEVARGAGDAAGTGTRPGRSAADDARRLCGTRGGVSQREERRRRRRGGHRRGSGSHHRSLAP